MKDRHESMHAFEYGASRELMVRLEHDTDLVKSVAHLASSQGIKSGSFTAIGALKSARLGFYDQEKQEYRETRIDSACELASCTGNISLRDGQPFAHIHVVLADEAGNIRAGHLLEGIVFVTELHLRKLEGPKLERKYDEATKLWLWSA